MKAILKIITYRCATLIRNKTPRTERLTAAAQKHSSLSLSLSLSLSPSRSLSHATLQVRNIRRRGIPRQQQPRPQHRGYAQEHAAARETLKRARAKWKRSWVIERAVLPKPRSYVLRANRRYDITGGYSFPRALHLSLSLFYPRASKWFLSYYQREITNLYARLCDVEEERRRANYSLIRGGSSGGME